MNKVKNCAVNFFSFWILIYPAFTSTFKLCMDLWTFTHVINLLYWTKCHHKISVQNWFSTLDLYMPMNLISASHAVWKYHYFRWLVVWFLINIYCMRMRYIFIFLMCILLMTMCHWNILCNLPVCCCWTFSYPLWIHYFMLDSMYSL